MKHFLLFLFPLLLLSCQDYNANSFDQDRYGEVELTGSAAFKQAYPILKNHCMTCHFHAQWSEYTTENDWVVQENLVVAGDPDNSPLITRMLNYGGANSDMPQGGKLLPTDEYTAVKNWVNGMSP